MIEIKISNTGFVSGDAWEAIGYAGERNSRTINTVFSKELLGDNEEYSCGYAIKSCYLNRKEEIMFDGNEFLIPEEFMRYKTTLQLQFIIKSEDESYIFKSNVFNLYINPSIEVIESKLSDNAKNFIVVDTITDRDALPAIDLANGKIVKVNDIGDGTFQFYSWNEEAGKFEEAILGDGITEDEAKDLINQNLLRWSNIN